MIPGLRDDLIRDEGRQASAYPDSLGYLTIGVGHCIDKRIGCVLPDHIVDALLDYDIGQVEADLDQKLPWWRNQPPSVQRALGNMRFQLGNKFYKFTDMLAHLMVGDYIAAKAAALDSEWAHQTPQRAKRVADLIG